MLAGVLASDLCTEACNHAPLRWLIALEHVAKAEVACDVQL
jgi:hypothetical protein